MYLRSFCLEIDGLAVDADVDNDADGDHAGDDGGAAAGKEGQSDSRNGHEAHGHGDVFKNLKQEHAQKSDDDQRAVQIHGITDDSREADQQEGVDQNREGTAEEAQFLYDNRKNEVRLLHRDEVQTLLRSLKEPFSEETTGAHGNLGLPDLVVAGKT